MTVDRTDDAVLVVQDLHLSYRTRRAVSPAVRGVSFQVGAGQVLAIVGESGSGKTTLAHAILGLLPANAVHGGGQILLHGEAITAMAPARLRRLRGRTVSLIPQDPTVSLDPLRRVGPQVADVLQLHTTLDAAGRRDRVHELFERVGLRDPARSYHLYPHELSGGMRQRILIAAAVAVGPALIVADEPTSGLDATVQAQVLDLLDGLRESTATAVVLVTHDLGVAADRSDVLAVMRGGRLVEIGPTQEVLAAPRHDYTRQLLGSVPTRLVLQRPTAQSTAPVDRIAVQVRGLRKEYAGFTAIDDVSFDVRAGQTLAIVGESGSGKSTTARIVAGLTEPTAGSVRVLDTDVTTASSLALRQLRRDVQIVFQNPYSSFDPRFDVYDVVEEPLRCFQPPRLSRRRRGNEERVVAALDAAALSGDFARRHPRELSGGQRQRVALARALVLEPRIVILDEPVSALDVSVQAQILELLYGLQEAQQLTYLFISHDLAVVRSLSDRVAVMQHGRVVECGATDTVFTNPSSDYTAQLLQAIPGRRLPQQVSA